MSVVGHIADIFTRLSIVDNGSARHVDIHILTIGAMTLVLTTIATMLCEDMALVFQMEQGPVVVIATQIDAAPLAAIASVRTAIGVVLHMFQVHRALTALARAAHDLDIVYEIGFHNL